MHRKWRTYNILHDKTKTTTGLVYVECWVIVRTAVPNSVTAQIDSTTAAERRSEIPNSMDYAFMLRVTVTLTLTSSANPIN